MRRLGVGVHVLYGDLTYRVSLIGLVPREHLIHDDAQRITSLRASGHSPRACSGAM